VAPSFEQAGAGQAPFSKNVQLLRVFAVVAIVAGLCSRCRGEGCPENVKICNDLFRGKHWPYGHKTVAT
jgi:hypothetical protein